MADTATAALGPGGPPPTPAGQGRGRDRAGVRRTVVYVGGKIVGAIVSLLAVMFTSFFLFRIIPGDPVRTMTHGRPVSIEQKEALAREYGLDKPRVEQFVDYVSGLLRFDLGDSFQYNKPVTDLIADRLGPTVLLVGTSVVIAALIGLALGVNGAWNHGSTSDRVSTGVALTLWSVPTFWLGLILIVIFASGADLFPTGGMKTPGVSGWGTIPDVAHHMVLPVTTLVAVVFAQYLLIMRSSLLDELGSDYIVTARAKGLRDSMVRRRHAVPNALLPTVTLLFVNLGFVVFGSVLTETIFSWPGLGFAFYEALRVPDLPLVQGMFIFFSASVILMNLLAELLYPILDPRVRP